MFQPTKTTVFTPMSDLQQKSGVDGIVGVNESEQLAVRARGQLIHNDGRKIDKDYSLQNFMSIQEFIPTNGFMPVRLVSRGLNIVEDSMRMSRPSMAPQQIRDRPKYHLDPTLDQAVDDAFTNSIAPRLSLLDDDRIVYNQLKLSAGQHHRLLARLPLTDTAADRVRNMAQAIEREHEMGTLFTGQPIAGSVRDEVDPLSAPAQAPYGDGELYNEYEKVRLGLRFAQQFQDEKEGEEQQQEGDNGGLMGLLRADDHFAEWYDDFFQENIGLGSDIAAPGFKDALLPYLQKGPQELQRMAKQLESTLKNSAAQYRFYKQSPQYKREQEKAIRRAAELERTGVPAYQKVFGKEIEKAFSLMDMSNVRNPGDGLAGQENVGYNSRFVAWYTGAQIFDDPTASGGVPDSIRWIWDHLAPLERKDLIKRYRVMFMKYGEEEDEGDMFMGYQQTLGPEDQQTFNRSFNRGYEDYLDKVQEIPRGAIRQQIRNAYRNDFGWRKLLGGGLIALLTGLAYYQYGQGIGGMRALGNGGGDIQQLGGRYQVNGQYALPPAYGMYQLGPAGQGQVAAQEAAPVGAVAPLEQIDWGVAAGGAIAAGVALAAPVQAAEQRAAIADPAAEAALIEEVKEPALDQPDNVLQQVNLANMDNPINAPVQGPGPIGGRGILVQAAENPAAAIQQELRDYGGGGLDAQRALNELDNPLRAGMEKFDQAMVTKAHIKEGMTAANDLLILDRYGAASLPVRAVGAMGGTTSGGVMEEVRMRMARFIGLRTQEEAQKLALLRFEGSRPTEQQILKNIDDFLANTRIVEMTQRDLVVQMKSLIELKAQVIQARQHIANALPAVPQSTGLVATMFGSNQPQISPEQQEYKTAESKYMETQLAMQADYKLYDQIHANQDPRNTGIGGEEAWRRLVNDSWWSWLLDKGLNILGIDSMYKAFFAAGVVALGTYAVITNAPLLMGLAPGVMASVGTMRMITPTIPQLSGLANIAKVANVPLSSVGRLWQGVMSKLANAKEVPSGQEVLDYVGRNVVVDTFDSAAFDAKYQAIRDRGKRRQQENIDEWVRKNVLEKNLEFAERYMQKDAANRIATTYQEAIELQRQAAVAAYKQPEPVQVMPAPQMLTAEVANPFALPGKGKTLNVLGKRYKRKPGKGGKMMTLFKRNAPAMKRYT